MGMFSYICKGCGQELVERELVRLNGCKGEYDGYGRAGGFEDDTGSVVAWHERCHKAATQQQRDDETPSMSAPNQGFGPSHLEFLPGYQPDAPCKYSVSIRGLTEEDREQKGFRETHFVLTTKGWVDATLWEEASNGTPLPPHAAEMNLADPFEAMAQIDTLAQAINDSHAFVMALRDGAPSVKHVLNSYTLHVFGRQNSAFDSAFGGEPRWIEGMVYEYEREEVTKFAYGEVPSYVRTGCYKEGVTYRIGCRPEPKPELIPVPESSKPQVAQIMAEHGTPQQQEEALEFLAGPAGRLRGPRLTITEVPHGPRPSTPEKTSEDSHLDGIEASIDHLKGVLDRIDKQIKSLARKKKPKKAKAKAKK